MRDNGPVTQQEYELSIDAPLARAMLKKRVDDEFEAQLPGGLVRYAIVAIGYPA